MTAAEGRGEAGDEWRACLGLRLHGVLGAEARVRVATDCCAGYALPNPRYITCRCRLTDLSGNNYSALSRLTAQVTQATDT